MENNQASAAQHIIPESFEITRDKETGDHVRLSFFRGQDGFHAVLPRNQIALFVSHVLKEAEVSLNVLEDPAALDIGDVAAPLGRELRKLPDGGAILTFHIQTMDGKRAVPLHLSAEDARQLHRDLGAA